MATVVGSAIAYLDLDTSNFTAGLKTAQSLASQTSNTMSSSFSGLGSKLTSVGTTLTATITAPLLAIATAAESMTISFDSAMSQVQAISQSTGSEFEALRDKALEMGQNTKYTATEAADAFTYMAQAGWTAEEMLDGIEGVMNLAAASGESLSETTSILTTGLNAFGYEASDASHYADVLAQAAAATNTDVHNLGEALQYAGPVAGSFGYSIEDVSVALGLMANNGIDASMAGTTLRSALTTMIDPTDEQAAALEELGISLYDESGSARELSDVLVDLRSSMSGMTDEQKNSYLTTMFNTTALSGMMAIVNASDEDFNSLTESMQNCDGAAEEMAETMMDNLGGDLTLLKSALESLAISIGDILTPYLRTVVQAITEFVNTLTNSSEETKQFVVAIAAIAAAVGPVLTVIGKVITTFNKFRTSITSIMQAFNLARAGFTNFASQASTLGTALGSISAPMIAVVAVIGTLVAAFVTLYNTNEEFRDSINSTFSQIITTIKNFVSEVKERFSSLEIDFTAIVQTLKTVWETFCNAIAPVFEVAFGLVAEIVQTVTDVILGVIDTFIAVFQGDWKGAWEGVSDVVSSVFDLVLYVITNVVSQIILIISDWIVSMVKFAVSLGEQFLDAIVEWFQQIPTNVSNFIDSALDNVKQWTTNMGNQAKETGTNFLNYIISFFTQLPSKIGNFLSSALSTATTWKSNLVNQAKEAGSNFLNNVVSYIQQLPSKLSSLLNSAISALSSWVSNMGSKGREGSNSLISGVISAAANVGGQVASIGANIVSGVWQGIQNARSAFVSNVTSFFSGIVDSVKSALGISSPSKVFADEVGYWMPLGVSEGFQEEMPTAAKQIQAALNNSLDNLTTPDIATTLSMTTFTDTLTESLDYIATFYESIDTRLRNSIDSMTETLAYLIESGQLISDSTGNIGYVGANGFSSNVNSSSNVKDNTSGRTSSSGEGDTFIFYSNTSINEIEAARQLRNTKRDIAEGFY